MMSAIHVDSGMVLKRSFKKGGAIVGQNQNLKTHNKKGTQPIWLNPFLSLGARDENRTRTPIRARDFKSYSTPKH